MIPRLVINDQLADVRVIGEIHIKDNVGNPIADLMIRRLSENDKEIDVRLFISRTPDY